MVLSLNYFLQLPVNLIISKSFLSIFYWLCYYSFPNFFIPFIALCPATPTLSSIPLLSSCPWVTHIHSLTSTFHILFLTSPCLFCTCQLCFLFLVPFSPFSPLLPADNPPCDLHFCDSVLVLVVCLVFLFWFLFLFFRFSCWSLWVCCHFTVHSFDLLFLR